MKKVQWLAFAIGVATAIVGLFTPSWANETNNICWIAVFVMCAPYAASKK